MKTIKQQVFINATPREVYEAYVDAKKHAVFTGANVKFEAKAGGKFDIWDGELTGENVKLVPGKKIVQKWRANDWPEGHYSDLKIELFGEGDGRRPGGRSGSEGTKLKLTQENVPDDKAEDIDSGWHEYYWEPMKEYFKKGATG